MPATVRPSLPAERTRDAAAPHGPASRTPPTTSNERANSTPSSHLSMHKNLGIGGATFNTLAVWLIQLAPRKARRAGRLSHHQGQAERPAYRGNHPANRTLRSTRMN